MTVYGRSAEAIANQEYESGGSEPEDDMEVAHVHLDAATLATLGTVPVEVVPAPGANKIIVVIAGSFFYNRGTEDYDTPNVNFYFGDPINNIQVTNANGALSGSVDRAGLFNTSWFTSLGAAAELVINQPVKAQLSDGVDPTDGNGSLDVWVYYRVQDVS